MKAFISSRIPEKWLNKIAEKFDVDHYDWAAEGGMLSREEFLTRMQGCDLIVTESDEIDAAMLNSCPDLFAIVDFRGTVVNVDIEAANRNGVVIINTPGRNADAVADLTVAFMIMAARNVLPSIQTLKSGDWAKHGKRYAYAIHQGYDLPGKMVGLLGLGHIGRQVAKRLAGFGVTLIGYDPGVSASVAESVGVKKVELDTVFEESDFLSLHLPIIEQTKNMIGERELRMMKSTSYLINTSRAGVVEEKALIRCLQEKWIAGAAIDVYHQEPIDSDYPLLSLPNVICTPHIGGASHDVVNHMAEIGIMGLTDFLIGNESNTIVNPEAIGRAREKMTLKLEKNKE
jgi:phosphoglycerate dehydrogenase-like enzyme